MGGLTFGAIGAALIAAVVSLIGLVLGKEQKTSEFRQEWINKLREEITSYVTNVSAISDQINFDFKDYNEKLKHLAPYYVAINTAANSIKLRLNPDEKEAKAVLEIMAKIENASQDDDDFKSEKISQLESELISSAQKLLKSEWNRVKSGEKTFKMAKYSALVLTVLLSGALVYASVTQSVANEGSEPPEVAQYEDEAAPDAPLLPAPTPSAPTVPVPSATVNEQVTGK